MDLNLIRNYVIRDKYYVENIGGYIIPKVLENNINLCSNRQSILLNKDSKYSRNFRKFIDSKLTTEKYLEYIREFPIIIENRELWNDILDKFSISVNDKMRKINYFLIDYFFPYLGISIEIDSEYHNTRLIYDKARDIYIENVYGIIIYRFYKFGSSDEYTIPYINRFGNTVNNILCYLKNNNLLMNKIVIDYSKTIVKNFIKDNIRSFNFIDIIINFVGFNEFFLKRSLTIDLKLLSKLSNEISGKPYNKLKQISLEKLFLDNISNLVYNIYQKTLNFI